MITVPSRIDLHTFPSDDPNFRLFAHAQIAHLETLDPERLQSLIRERYPLAVVRVRSDLARLGTEGVVWYAFRRAAVDPPEDRWWEDETSWAIIDGDRVLLLASEGFAAIVEVPLTLLIGKQIDDLANPADHTAAEDVAALWIELVAAGQVHGTLRFNRLDGSAREIEYHVECAGDRPTRSRAAIRERATRDLSA
jgi:hypothetical protein